MEPYESNPYTSVDSNEEEKQLNENNDKVEFHDDGINGDVIMPENKQFAGLTKEELINYAKDPFWSRLRMFLLVLFWVIWVGMLVGAVLIVVFTRGCPYDHQKEWYKRQSVYQICPASFKDTNADGIGDLNGATSEISYIKSLGIGALWLTSIYHGPDDLPSDKVSNYTNIHEKMGTVEDFKALVQAVHKNDMKIILDFIPNHSSIDHPWFNLSRNSSTANKYHDYYIWANASASNGPPTDLRTPSGEPAWHFDETRKQYYLHTFGKDQPDLNMHSKALQGEFGRILAHWHTLGVDGFVIKHANFLIEPHTNRPGNDSAKFAIHRSVDVVVNWRTILNRILKDNDERHDHIVMIAEFDDVPGNTKKLFFGNRTARGVDMVMNNVLTNLKVMPVAYELKEEIVKYSEHLPPDRQQTWRIGSPDTSRAASRFGPDFIDTMNIINVMLPGTPFVYYGEEIGMTDNAAGKANDRYRTPMQFNSSSNGGFTSAAPWMAVNTPTENVQKQLSQEKSHLKLLAKVLKLRNEREALVERNQTFDPIDTSSEVFAFVRRHVHRQTSYIVAADLRSTGGAEERDLTSRDVTGEGWIELCSIDGEKKEGDFVHLAHVATLPKQVMVLRVGDVDELPEVTLKKQEAAAKNQTGV